MTTDAARTGWLRWSASAIGKNPAAILPEGLFRYIVATSWIHQLSLVVLSVVIFLLEVVPLELQRRVVNDVVKHRPYTAIVILCAAYAGAVLLQGATMASTKQRLLAEAR